MSDDPLFKDGIKRALGLVDLPSNDQTHYENLGRFIAAFANAEGILHVIARKLSGLSDEKARLLFGGMRLADVTDRIRGFIQLDKIDGKNSDFADIESCLVQLGHISGRRHNIVHRGATYFAGSFIVSNTMVAKTLAGIETELVTEQALKDMTADCGVIFLLLLYITNPTPPNENWRATLQQRAWQYKPPAPKPQSPKRRDTPGSPKPPPDASQGVTTGAPASA